MGEITVEIRGLSGSHSYTFDNENGDVSVEQVRQAADVAEGMVLRLNGERVSDEAGTLVGDGAVLVSTAPEAKHGLA